MNIKISSLAKKQLKKVPEHINTKFEYWCDLIETIGLLENIKGFMTNL